jgi:FtsZ-binding cell division protein ZapB
LEKELRSVKQKLQIADNKLLEVNDKLERRDRLIENLNRSQNERVFSVDKFKNEVASSRKRVEELQRTEASLRNENLVLQERIRDANSRIEIALKV